MPILRGSCHCGQLRVVFDTELEPEALPVRACGCSFCRRHAPRFTSDPSGRVRFEIGEPALTSHYRFALGSADFLVCARCGVFVGAVMSDESGALAVLNLHALDARDRFVQPAQTMDYDAEDLEARVARRRQRWTPAEIR
jgi:hypothetical protein